MNPLTRLACSKKATVWLVYLTVTAILFTVVIVLVATRSLDTEFARWALSHWITYVGAATAAYTGAQAFAERLNYTQPEIREGLRERIGTLNREQINNVSDSQAAPQNYPGVIKSGRLEP